MGTIENSLLAFHHLKIFINKLYVKYDTINLNN
jgi:hypothetical protein